MRLEGREGSTNVEDRRGQRLGGGGGGGRAGLGIGGLLLVLVISYFTGQNPLQLLGSIQEAQGPVEESRSADASAKPPEDQLGLFTRRVLKDTEITWTEVFRGMNEAYTEPPLVLFSGRTRSGCGLASADTGPFYCPADSKVYLDPGFFDQLKEQFGAPGDFAQAYVIAHEIGHHVQNLMGISDQVSEVQSRGSKREGNAASVRLELQADCFAGVWGFHANKRQIIDPGDFEEGMRAAASIGDDSIQEMSGESVRPESWTHGSGEQRQFWLRRGLSTGDPARCDTFKERRP